MGINQFSGNDATGANLGHDKLVEDVQGAISQMAFVPVGFEFATDTEALTKANWITSIKAAAANRVYITPKASACADKTKEATMEESPLLGSRRTKKAIKAWELTFGRENEKLYQAMKKFDGKKTDVMIFDTNGNIIGTTPDGTKVKGFRITTVIVSDRKISDGTKLSEFTVMVTLEDIAEWENAKVVLQPTELAAPWYPEDLDGVYNVDLTKISASSTVAVISVNIDSYTTTDPAGQVTTLVKADFVQKSSVGVAKTITGTVVDNLDGTYSITSSIASGDTFNLVATSAIANAALFIDSTGAVSVGTVV